MVLSKLTEGKQRAGEKKEMLKGTKIHPFEDGEEYK